MVDQLGYGPRLHKDVPRMKTSALEEMLNKAVTALQQVSDEL